MKTPGHTPAIERGILGYKQNSKVTAASATYTAQKILLMSPLDIFPVVLPTEVLKALVHQLTTVLATGKRKITARVLEDLTGTCISSVEACYQTFLVELTFRFCEVAACTGKLCSRYPGCDRLQSDVFQLH